MISEEGRKNIYGSGDIKKFFKRHGIVLDPKGFKQMEMCGQAFEAEGVEAKAWRPGAQS